MFTFYIHFIDKRLMFYAKEKYVCKNKWCKIKYIFHFCFSNYLYFSFFLKALKASHIPGSPAKENIFRKIWCNLVHLSEYSSFNQFKCKELTKQECKIRWAKLSILVEILKYLSSRWINFLTKWQRDWHRQTCFRIESSDNQLVGP